MYIRNLSAMIICAPSALQLKIMQNTVGENSRSQRWAGMCLEGQLSAPAILVMTKAPALRALEEKVFAPLAEKWTIAEV